MKKIIALLPLLVFLGGGVGLVGAGWFWWSVPPGSNETKVDFTVPEGAGVATVAEGLARAGLLRWPLAFRFYTRYTGGEAKLKTGTYELSQGMLPREILAKLVKGEIKLVAFSIPEGFNVWQVAERLAVVFPHVGVAEWKAAMSDPRYLEGLPAAARTLEGYLFPETYVIRPKAGVAEVIGAMRKAFDKAFTEEIASAGEALGLDAHAVVTLASIVEKETGRAEERPRISAVFHNRMRRGMRLQTDPTVIYGIWDRYDGNIRRKDLLEPTPYNTYVIPGLPPGPIANPGRAALEAAVRPLDAKDLYFVGRGDGSHHFSATLEEHNKAVQEFQIKPFRAKARGK